MKQPINFFKRLHKQSIRVNGFSYQIQEPNIPTKPRLWIYPDRVHPSVANVIYIDFKWDKAICSAFVVRPGYGDGGECVIAGIGISSKHIQHPNEFINRFLYQIVSDIHQTGKHIWQ
jgi:hypothetical protein